MNDVYQVVDWESITVMPKHVAFKGDNKLFLRARVIQKRQYLEFSGSDNGEPTVGNEVFTNPDGSIRIKSNHYGMFWRRNSSPHWIWGDSTDPTSSNPDTVFWPVRVSNNVVALRNKGNNQFCKRLTANSITSCLSASEATASLFARLEVEELVISRSIYNVEFRLLDARIYNETVKTMTGSTISNDSPNANTTTMKLTYSDTRSRMWQSSVSFSYGIKSTISTGVPVIGEGTIEIGWEASADYTWGQTHDSSVDVDVDYTVTVSPYSKATVRLLATEGTCDVPFSYTQRDVLFDGRPVINRMNDGIYTGINLYNFHWDNTEEKLTADEIKLAQEDEEKNIKLQVETTSKITNVVEQEEIDQGDE